MATSGVVLSPVKEENLMSVRSLHGREPARDGIQIYLVTVDSVTAMRVLPSDTIASVKLKIQACKGFYVKQQKLVYGGRELARSESLIRDYGVTDGNVLNLVLRLLDLQVVTVKTVSGKEFVFHVERSRSIRDLKQWIAQKDRGLSSDEQELIFKGTKLEDQRLVDDLLSGNDDVVHLFVRRTAKVRTKTVGNDVELSIVASDESDSPQRNDEFNGAVGRGMSALQLAERPPLMPREEPRNYRDNFIECQELVRRPPRNPSLLEPVTRSVKRKLSPAFQDLINVARGGLERGQSPIRSEEGSGGAYFMRDSTGTKYVGVFKPMDEEPLAENNPRGLPVSSNGEGLKKGTRVGEGAYREVAAFILDHPVTGARSVGSDELGFAGVPPTMMVRCSHGAFHVSNGYDRLGPKTKLGSLQKFVESYSNCEDMGPAAFPVDEVHKIAVLDMRLANADRHGGNILVCQQGGQPPYLWRLVPIDHGYCLPESFFQLKFQLHMERFMTNFTRFLFEDQPLCWFLLQLDSSYWSSTPLSAHLQPSYGSLYGSFHGSTWYFEDFMIKTISILKLIFYIQSFKAPLPDLMVMTATVFSMMKEVLNMTRSWSPHQGGMCVMMPPFLVPCLLLSCLH